MSSSNPIAIVEIISQGPQGPAGQDGAQGSATVAIGTVTTGNAGTNASVANSGTTTAAILDFTIPRGDTGPQGNQGDQGIQGIQGTAGNDGAAATIAVGTVTTGAAGSSATVTNSGSSSAATFNFTIPKGDTGAQGPAGADGGISDGDKGDIVVSNSGATFTIDNDVVTAAKLADTSVTAGSYTNTNITVDAQGRITAAASGSAGGVTSVTGTTPIVSSGGATPAISISAATTSAAGSMSAADKTKLDGIESNSTADQTASEIKTLLQSDKLTVNEIADDAITTAKILDDAVTDAKLANSINTAIAANTAKVTNATHTGDVTGSTALTIANDAVTTDKIADDAVTADKLANSINTEIAANTAKVTNATHTGDVTGATALTIADDAVTYAKIQNVSATDRILGRDSAGAGVIEEITPANLRTMINVEDGADVTDATNVDAAGAVMNTDTSTAAMSFVVDEDNMASDSATKVPTQQSVKAYVDANSSDTTYTAGTGLTLSGTTFNVSAIALTTVQTAANESAHLNLTTQEGDIVVRSDQNKSYVRNSGAAGTMADFTELLTPTDQVLSVNGNTGAISAAQIAAAVEAATDSNTFTDADHTKLNAIESGATADQTATEIKTAYESNSNTNAFTDAEQTKLSGIEASATADQTAAEIRTLVESATDSNVFTDADHTKLNGIETGATADQTKSDIDALGIAATTAATLATARNIAGVAFDGSANISLNNNAITNGAGYITDLVSDTTPQLGGDLDMNSKFISSGILGVKNTGSQSELRLYCEVSNAHYASIKAPAHADFSGNITYTLPSGYGSNGQVLKSDGSGGTSWVDQPTANATHTGEVTGSTALTIADNVVDEANLKISNTPTDGYVLTAQSGNTGGLTWAAAASGLVGSSNEKLFVEAENQMDNSFTTTANFNYVAASPLIIASGVTLTVTASSTMTFV